MKPPAFATTIAGCALIWALSTVGMYIAQGHEIAKLKLEVMALQSQSIRTQTYHRLAEQDRATFEEFQHWRVSVTLASRKGWGYANRYIASYPLWLPGEPIPEWVYPPRWETARVFLDSSMPAGGAQ